MNEVSRAPQSATGTTLHADADQLRPIDFNGHTPAPPLTDADVDHALGAYGSSDPYRRDRYDSHAADRAFGDQPASDDTTED